MDSTDVRTLGIHDDPSLRSLADEAHALFPNQPIYYRRFEENSGRRGSSVVRSDRIHIEINVYRFLDLDHERSIRYAVGHELGHVIVKGHGHGVYARAEGKWESPAEQRLFKEITSAVEHPAVHSIMRRHGLTITDEMKNGREQLLRSGVTHLNDRANNLAICENASAFLDLLNMTADLATEDERTLMNRLDSEAPAAASVVRNLATMLSFGEPVSDGKSSAEKMLALFGRSHLSSNLLTFSTWKESLPSFERI